jgi:hypothetical protein
MEATLSDSGRGDGMAQELHLSLAKDTLVTINYQPVLLEMAEDLLQVSAVILYAATGDQHIIQVYEAVGQIKENVVHESLKCPRSSGRRAYRQIQIGRMALFLEHRPGQEALDNTLSAGRVSRR